MEHKKLIEYYPQHLAKYREFKAITAAEQIELDSILAEINQGLENQFVETADEEAISRYEKIYSVEPMPGATLEERRFNLMARLTEQTPYTQRKLAEMLAALCGENGYVLSLDIGNYAVQVGVELTAKNNELAVKRLMGNVLPCNLTWQVGLLYNQHSKLARFTHGQLSAYTHQALREEVLPNE
ncbi:YmfQ family protein [Anaerovorax odorimutans]|uniref:YmfQ family protein n=1 Tax=Anaerovorax odorimutans TaxID=109327 RepID=A0ABT1RQI9_9FIRM|nr:putative phage tail protein [Anaerovorax odorimutans]MCQ4637151.1 YmfQ family protein [Anaerovorax odorimutans]